MLDFNGQVVLITGAGSPKGIGSDDTLYALVDGRVHFERVGRDRKRCTVKQ